ncbi:MAG: hypothetical protein ABL963_12010 [Longimicrobiales bacterium]
MPDVKYDPEKAIDVRMDFDSPHVVTYWLWSRTAGDAWKLLATGTDEDAVTNTGHQHSVGPLEANSKIRIRAMFSGNPKTTYRASVVLRQGRRKIHADEWSGQTNANGVALEQDDLKLVEPA